VEVFRYKSSVYQYNREMGDEASVGDKGGLDVIVVAKGVSSSAYQYG
jgi:hypothetical protein